VSVDSKLLNRLTNISY